MPAQPVYRYFASRAYAESFIAGQIRCCSLAEYRAFEGDTARADRFEVQRLHKPKAGLVLTRLDGSKVPTNFTYSATASARDIFVLCTSLVLSSEQFDTFGATCVVAIRSPGQLKGRINDALGQRFRGQPWELLSGPVTYYDVEDDVGIGWAPHRSAFCKLRTGYEDQAEMRFAFGLNNAFSPQAAMHELREGDFDPPPKEFPPPIVLAAKPMANFCTLIDR